MAAAAEHLSMYDEHDGGAIAMAIHASGEGQATMEKFQPALMNGKFTRSMRRGVVTFVWKPGTQLDVRMTLCVFVEGG